MRFSFLPNTKVSNTNTGGPAFLYGDYSHGGEAGMTLRDYFAAKAMQGLLSTGTTNDADTIAEWSYIYADAMLEAREE